MVNLFLESLQEHVQRVERLDARQRASDPWVQFLLTQPGARRLLGSRHMLLPEKMRERSYIAMVLYCLSNDDATRSAVSTTQAKSVRKAASGLQIALSPTGVLDAAAVTNHFSNELNRLSGFQSATSGPIRNLKGNPQRRQFIWEVAEACYRTFRFFHSLAITEIVSLRWDDIDERTVRRELALPRQVEIQLKVDGDLRLEKTSKVESARAIDRASATPDAVDGMSGFAKQIEAVRKALLALDDERARHFLTTSFNQSLAEFDASVGDE